MVGAIFLQTATNTPEFTGRAIMKPTPVTDSFRTVLELVGIFFFSSDSLRRQQ
jgi:hypothetical protein